MKASIAMAACNGASYIAQQLDSIANQTVRPFEVVVSDDASVDRTLEIVRHFAATVPFPVRVIVNRENLGYVENFSRALSQCTGEIVFLSDQDDVWLPHKLETILRSFAEHEETELVVHDLDFCREDLTPIGETKMQRMSRLGNVDRDYVVGMATAIRSRFLRHCLPIPKEHGLSHDRWLHMCADALGRKRILPEVLALYRRHPLTATVANPMNSPVPSSPWAVALARWNNWLTRMRSILDQPCLDDRRSEMRASWLVEKRAILVDECYVRAQSVDREILEGQERARVVRERQRIWQLPRWKRVWPILSLLQRGLYRRFFSRRSAIKDLLVSRD